VPPCSCRAGIAEARTRCRLRHVRIGFERRDDLAEPVRPAVRRWR
jgi:hypothetical protein